jgi:hypothetical protein
MFQLARNFLFLATLAALTACATGASNQQPISGGDHAADSGGKLKATSVAVAIRNAQLNTRAGHYNSGYLRFYSGTPPATVDTALSGNTLLASCTFSATAFATASGGSATANAITADSDADASGTVSFARAFESDGTTAIEQFTVGTSGTDITVPTTTVTQHIQFSVTSLTLTQP